MASLLPVFLDLKDKSVLLVGGGKVALEKLEKLVHTGARVHVIALAFQPETLAFIMAHDLSWEQRAWQTADLAARFLVISAVNVANEHDRLAEEARAGKVLINAVDAPKASDFYFAAQIQRGPLQLAISTQGLFPGVARAIRLWLEEFLPPDITEEFQELVTLRLAVRKHIPDTVERMQALRDQLQIWINQGAPQRRGEIS